MSGFVRQNGTDCAFTTADSWVILNPIEQSIKRKIEAAGVPLKDWDIKINRGILTGCNEAFIIDEAKRAELIEADPNSAEIIRPILRGRDIKRYGYNFAGLYLIAAHNGIPEKNIPRVDINDYPAIKHHLDQYWDKLSKRADMGDTPYNLRSCTYMEDFSLQKIVWSRLMRLSANDIDAFPRFCLVPQDYYTVDSLCFFTGQSLKYLLTALNSEYAAYYFFNTVATLDNGGFQMRQQYVDNIKIPPDNGKNLYDAFNFSLEEVQYISSVVNARKKEILIKCLR